MIYLDHAATTPLDPTVLKAMLPFFSDKFGNASSIHSLGQDAAGHIASARLAVSEILHCHPQEIIFTGGGTESDNLAVLGAARALGKGHVIVSSIEHHAVLHAAKQLTKEGFEVTYLPVDEYGQVNRQELLDNLRPDTILVSIMYANNEIGTIQPIAEIGQELRTRGIIFHTDAVQAAGTLDLDVEKLQVDLLSLSAHKFYGPKGVGALYRRRGIKLTPLMYGGGQEEKLRPSTYNTPGIIGLATALKLAVSKQDLENKRLSTLRDYAIQNLFKRIPDCQLNGHPQFRLPNNVNISVHRIEGESMILRLDLAGFAVSSGSACTSGTLDPSHVLLAIGLDHGTAHGSLRITLGQATTQENIEDFIDTLSKVVEDLRAMSPLV